MLNGMSPTLHLTPPLTTRPLRQDDASSVCALVREAEEHDIGEPMTDLEDILSDWQRPSFDLGTQSIGVFQRHEMVACAEVFGGRRADAYVRPGHRGRGIGTALLRWTWDTARAAGGTLVGQPVPEGGSAAELLRANGYQELWTSWMLDLPPDAPLEQPHLPPGITIKPYQPGRDERAAFQTVEDAFGEWPDRDPSAFDDWAAMVLQRQGFEPWQLLLAFDGSGDVVGVCYVIISGDSVFVSQLAVRRNQRGRGLGRALLLRAFNEGRQHGTRRAELSTDSRTGALGLYLHVGMRITHTFVHLAKPLDAGP